MEDFEPLKPAPREAVQSASQRLQYIRVGKFSDAFGHIVAQQWRVDSAARRDTWAVVDSKLECELLWSEIVNQEASSGLATDTESILMVGPGPDWQVSGDGKLKLMTFKDLAPFLAQCFVQRWRWPRSLAVQP